jgi:lipopolysaccharide export system protein LptC
VTQKSATKKRGRLQHLTPPRRRRVSSQGAHTRFVRIAKLALTLSALGLVGIVILRMTHDQNLTPTSLPAANGPAASGSAPRAAQMDLIKPKYEGHDEKSRPYTISADRAHRVMGRDQEVSLDNPKGDVTLEDGSSVAASAPQGLYNRTASSLYLSGGVTIFHNAGYELHLQDVTVDLKTKHSQSQNPVNGQGPKGTLEGRSIDISDGGELIVVGGPATLTLRNLKEKQGSHG